MDKKYDFQKQKISQKSFLELAKHNKAYLKESPVLWCTECRTSIAQAELETKECETTFNYLNFHTPIGSLLIATTRPELLAGCVCIFVHPEDIRYKEYVGKTAKVPLYDFEIPILTDENVSMDKGTGAVMCATFGDSTDMEWYQKHGLPYKKVIMPDGTIHQEAAFIGGMTVRKARAYMIELLLEKGLLVKQETMNHMIAIHERCGTDVELIPSKQWYIDVLSDKEKYLKAADEINWHPAHMKNRYKIWVENLKWDWCISRQRYFGVPFPVWYCRDCGKPVFAEEEQLPVNPLETGPLHACDCGCGEFVPEEAVFDTWATSSVTTMINARYGEENDISNEIFPMGMRCQAHEIGQARHEIDDLFWKDFCDYYIEIAKERLYQPEKHGEAQRISGQIAVYYSLLGILKLYAIYTPYVTEYIYQDFYQKYEKEISLHQTIWEIKPEERVYLEFGEHLKEVIAGVRKEKTEKQMSMKDLIPELIITCPKKFRDFYKKSEKDIKACTGAQKIIIRN